MKRLIPLAAVSMFCLAAFTFACSTDEANPSPDAQVPDAQAPDAEPEKDGAPAVDAADGATTPDKPVTVLSTTDDVLDIGIMKGKLYLLLASPSRVETCDGAACGARTVRVANAQMPPEMVRVPLGAPNFYLNSRMAVLPLGAADAVIIAQNGNVPCALDCVTAPSDNPGVYAVGTQPPELLWRMSFAEFTKGANASTVEDTRGSALWFRNNRNNEAAGSSSMVLLSLKPTAAADRIELGASRTDTHAPMTSYVGSLLAGAHRIGAPYITQSGPTTGLFAIDTTSATSNATDTSVDINDATWLTTTGSLRFARNAQTTNAAQFVQSAKGTTQNTIVTLPGVTSATTVIGTELGLLWYTPLSASDLDAGVGGPLVFSFCADADLVAKTCAPKLLTLEVDEVTRVKDEAPYLYVFGRRAGKNVVVRFTP